MLPNSNVAIEKIHPIQRLKQHSFTEGRVYVFKKYHY